MQNRTQIPVTQPLAVSALCLCGQPVKPGRKSCVECRAKRVAYQNKVSKARRAKGLCGTCKRVAAAGHSLCDYHLRTMRERAIVRNRERANAGLCRQCARPSELGQTYCLIHWRIRNKTQGSLPQPARSALNRFRKQEAKKAADARCRKEREFLNRNLHLIKSERTRELLRMRYGYTKADCKTLGEAGAIFGVTYERVRQLKESAEETIRMYTIEKDIPLPEGRFNTQVAELREQFKVMEPGDSFTVPVDKTNVKLYEAAKSLKFIVTTRKTQDGQIRVWLVSKNGVNVREAGSGDNNDTVERSLPSST